MLTTLLIPVLSLINPGRLPDTTAFHLWGMDKIAHMLMYALLTTAWAYAIPAGMRVKIRIMTSITLSAAFFGLLMEFCQFLFTEARSMDLLDAAANLAGSAVAAMAIYVISIRNDRENRKIPSADSQNQ